MALQTIPVIPFVTGLEKDKEPFLLENDAFPILTDCYLYQGRIIKKAKNKQRNSKLLNILLGGTVVYLVAKD